jgi:hypothetical protein
VKHIDFPLQGLWTSSIAGTAAAPAVTLPSLIGIYFSIKFPLQGSRFNLPWARLAAHLSGVGA